MSKLLKEGNNIHICFNESVTNSPVCAWVLFPYPIRHLILISRKASKQPDLYLKLYDRIEIRQASRQQWSQSEVLIQTANLATWDFTRSYDKTSYRILKQGPDRLCAWNYGASVANALTR